MVAPKEARKNLLHLFALLILLITSTILITRPAQCLEQTLVQSKAPTHEPAEHGLSSLPATPPASIQDASRSMGMIDGGPYTQPNIYVQPKVVATQYAVSDPHRWRPQPASGSTPPPDDYTPVHEHPVSLVGYSTFTSSQSPRPSEVSEDDIVETTPVSKPNNTGELATLVKPTNGSISSVAPAAISETALFSRTRNNINNEFSTPQPSIIARGPSLATVKTETASPSAPPPPSPTTTSTQFTLVNKPIDQTITTQATNVFITASPKPPSSTMTMLPLSPVTKPNTQSSSVHPLLIYSIRYEIRSFDLMSSVSNATRVPNGPSIANSALIDQHHFGYKHSPGKTLIAGLKNTIGLDFYYSPTESYIFWIDVMEEKIFRGTMANGIITNVNMIIQGGLASAEGLAVDWIAKNIYWVESTLDHIEVANMNGTCRRTLIAGDMESPRAISVDPRYGLMFWTDWDKRSPRIERATMAGDDRRKLVDIKEVNGGWPNGLTLDYDALKIYWIDANSDSIHVVDYEGKNHKSLLQKIRSLGHPFAITLYENNIYWTDWKTNLISTANKYNGSDAKEVQRQQSRLFDIKVFHPNRQPELTPESANPCAINNGNCSHLCLLNTNATRVCTCPHLMRLTQDNQTCESYERVLLIGRLHEIRAVDITKPLYHIMAPITIPKVFSPRQFEYDTKSRSIFWADSATNEVKRAHIAGNNTETIIDVIIDAPSGLALDWISGNIYVTSAAPSLKSGKIFISNLNGEFISVLMDGQRGVISPKSVAVHPPLGLLFCIDETETSEPLIFVASMDGRNKRIIASKRYDPSLSNPSNLAVDLDANRVYWVNQANSPQENATIQYYDIYKNQVITIYDESEIPQEQRINPGVICVDGDYLIISSRPPNETIIRAPKNNITDRAVYKTQMLDQILALRVYNSSSQVGTNACSSPYNGGCSQLCVPTNSTHRTCKCTMGYSINPFNETECLGKDKFLIYSYNLGMKGISLEPNSSADDYHLPPIHRAFRASSIDYVHRDNLIYWVDNEEGSITRINRDTTNYQVIIQGLESEECIGIDWVAGNIYWLDPYYDIIEVARLNGTNRFVIISGDMDKANGIVVNALHGYLVWSDIGSMPKIETARLDGSNRSVVVSTGLMRIDDLAIDYQEDYIYWVDSTMSTIERIRVDGSGRQKVYSEPTSVQSLQHHLVSLAVHGDYLYVADSAYNQGSIIRFNKNNSSASIGIQTNLGEGIRDIAIFAEQPMPSVEENPCVKDNGGCQDLCLYLGQQGQKRCVCSHGKLRADGHTCEPYDTFIMFSKLSQIDSLHIEDNEPHHNSPYPPITIETKGSIISLTIDYDAQRVIYSEMTRDQICSVRFNGTDRKVLVEKQSFVEGIAFTGDQLYWTSIQDNYISRLNTSSDGHLKMSCDEKSASCKPATVEKLIKLEPDDKPRGIAVDSCSDYVYWTNWNVNASIQRASPRTGYKIESIIKTNIRVPNGIAIDHKRRKLYWCDARLDKIETCNMDGTGRIVLISALPQHPFALAVWKDYIFWTDWLARGVFKADKYTGQRAVQIKKVAQRPMGIAVASPDVNTCALDPCATNNGGCPPDHVCESNQNYLGETHTTCQQPVDHKLMVHHTIPPFSPDGQACKSNSLYGSSNCGPSVPSNSTQYIDIIRDSLERYRGDAQQQQQSPSHPPVPFTKSGDTLAAYETIAKEGSTAPYDVPISQPKPFSSDRVPVKVPPPSRQPSAFSTRSRTSVSTTTLSSGFSSSAPRHGTQPTPVSPLPASSPQAIPASSLTPPPCQIVASSPHSITPDALTGQECKTHSEFKCYLSEKLICIPSERRCDGIPDCPSKEDEGDCSFSSRGQYNPKQESDWHRYVTVILIILCAALAALFMVFGNRNRRRWFVSSNNGFNHSKMFEDNGTNIEISNPMFDEDDNSNLMNCPFSIDLDETTTNFSNPLYERQILLVNDKTPKA